MPLKVRMESQTLCVNDAQRLTHLRGYLLERSPLCSSFFQNIFSLKTFNCPICSVPRQRFYSSATLTLIAPRSHLCYFFRLEIVLEQAACNIMAYSGFFGRRNSSSSEARWKNTQRPDCLSALCLEASLQRGSVLSSNCVYLK